MGKNAGLSLSSTGWLPSKPSWLQELDVARGRQRIGRPALSTPHATGRQTTTARTTGRRTLSVPPRVGRQPLLPATDVGRGKPRPLSTLLPLPHPSQLRPVCPQLCCTCPRTNPSQLCPVRSGLCRTCPRPHSCQLCTGPTQLPAGGA